MPFLEQTPYYQSHMILEREAMLAKSGLPGAYNTLFANQMGRGSINASAGCVSNEEINAQLQLLQRQHAASHQYESHFLQNQVDRKRTQFQKSRSTEMKKLQQEDYHAAAAGNGAADLYNVTRHPTIDGKLVGGGTNLPLQQRLKLHLNPGKQQQQLVAVCAAAATAPKFRSQ